MTASLFPLFADLRDRSVLVVGGGAVAERKVEALLRAGAHALVGAPQLSPILQQWAGHGRIRWLCGEFVERWLDDEPVWLVVATTDDRRVNRAVAAAGQARRLLVNVVDDAELSSFQVPAVVDRGPLQIAISSGGGAPMVTRHLRKQLEASLDEAWGALTALFARKRAAICEHFPDIAERRRFFDAQLAGPLLRLLRQRQPRHAEAHLQRALQRTQAEPASGSVVLVGAGPGDPGLLTLNALRALNEADVILHDRLVSDAVLQLARRDAPRIEVGKSAQGHSTRQEHIHELMLQHARAGRRVVRLKGGDPFVFGRGGEELEFLRDHDIAYEVVPGITAALACAAYAAIPLTHREHAQSLRLVTAHCKDSLDTLDWQALGQERQTLAFYMAVAGLEQIQQRLLQAGRAADTPFALIENGSRPQQRVVTGVLADLHGAAQRHAVCSPALLVVGEVAALASRLHWFGEPPLADAVATRSPHSVTSTAPDLAHAA